MNANIAALLYLAAGVLFIMALRGLSSPASSRRGNLYGMIGMGIAIGTTLIAKTADAGVVTWLLIVLGIAIGGGVGAITARRIAMTQMPQLVAAFHSLVGLAAVFVAAGAVYSPAAFGILSGNGSDIKVESLLEMAIGLAIGAITFSGSVIAFAKLDGRMSGSPIMLPFRHLINIALALGIALLVWAFASDGGANAGWLFWIIAALSFVIGVTLIIPIGGADMPVVVSMLNSYSGWAAAALGFTLHNEALLITGALVGSSGAILSYIMCKGMNRSFISVILGGFGGETAVADGHVETRPVKQGSADDAAFIMKNAGSVIIVPGYGMAVAQAQHALREMADKLKAEGVKVSYAIHPVAGRMPGHMNVLLAEASVPYDEVFELEDINSQFAQADVAYVIGANDVTNPSAKTDPKSPIFGMPILDVEKAKTVLFIKRGMGSGYAGVENELFFRDNTMMLFADAKKMTEEIVKALGVIAMRLVAGFISAFLLAVPAFANVAPPPLESPERAGEAAFAFMENFNAGNIEGIASTYTDAGDFMWIENGTVTFKGKAAAVEGMKQRLAASPGARLETAQGWSITPAGEGGSLITAEFTLYRKTPETGAETAVVSGVMTLMLRLEGGEWRIVNGHTSSAISMK